MAKEQEVELKVARAHQPDAYKGIARIDKTVMHKLGLERGDIISIKGQRETVAIVDSAYPSDHGEEIIRIDGIIRKNAKAEEGYNVKISKAEVREAESITIAPAQKGMRVQIRGDPDAFKMSLLGRAVTEGDLLVLGGTQQRKDLMSDMSELGDLFGGLEDFISSFGFGSNMGMFGGGVQQIKFIVTKTSPNGPLVIGENTEIVLKENYSETVEESVDTKKPHKTFEITYEDIGGLGDAVDKIREMIEIPMKHPEVFERLGIEPPKGVLLYGPPGTGKTLLAKAVATETDAHFILLNGPEVMSKFYGESEKKVREIFEEAEKNSPAIIFIDEIDAIASKREEGNGEVEKRVVSQLLTMMDGLKSRGKVVVIGATNRPNAIDPALRRPGRFDREIEVGVPDKEGRMQILQIHKRNVPMHHWENAVFENLLEQRRVGFEKSAEDKIKELTEKISNYKKESKDAQKEIDEMKLKLEDLKNDQKKNKTKLSATKKQFENLQEELQSLRENSSVMERILKKNKELNQKKEEFNELKNYVEDVETELRDIDDKDKNLRKKIEDNKSFVNSSEENIERLKSDIEIVKKANKKYELVAKDKDKRNLLINKINELTQSLSKLDDADARTVFLKQSKDDFKKEYEEIVKPLLDSKIISQDFRAEVVRESVNKLLNDLASRTHGFVGADLESLIRESAMAALRRTLPNINLANEEVSREELNELQVTGDDFQIAFKSVKPSGMRDVLVETPNIHWEDIGGIENVKQDLKEAVEWPLKHPQAFKNLGIRAPKGVLLYGPPGTGKTLLAKAVANESESNFIQVKGPELLSMWVGKSEEGVRKIFEKARQVSPCVVFFDEIDSLAGRRGGDHSGGSKVTESVLNQMLAEMDGIETLSNVVVIGATNRPDMLDQALMRPGRFDRIVYVGVPNEAGRLQILKIHTKNMPLGSDVKIEDIAKNTDGYTGADLESLVREAAMLALRKDIDAKEVGKKYFDEAMKKVSASVTQNDQDRYKQIEQQYLRSAKAALPDRTSYAG